MIVSILKVLTKLAFHFTETPVGSDGSLVFDKPLRLASGLTDPMVDSQSTMQEALSSFFTCGVVLSATTSDGVWTWDKSLTEKRTLGRALV